MSYCWQLLQVVNQGAETLRRADEVLEKQLQPLDPWAVRHETVELVGVGGVELRESRVSGGRRDVLADAPHARVVGVLVLVGQEEVVQELGALRMGGVLEDGAALAPGGEEAVLGDGDVEGGGGEHANAAAKGCGVGAVGLAHECGRGGRAANPARILGEQLLEPVETVLLKTVVIQLASVSLSFSHVLGFNLRQVECEKNGVVVVGICEDQFVLELGLQEIRVLYGAICHLVCIPDIAPAKDNDSVPSSPGVAELWVELVEIQRFVP